MKSRRMRTRTSDIVITKVIGENEEGLTLFVPKDMNGTFHLTEGDAFLSVVFVKSDGTGGVQSWCPWADGPVMKS